MSYQSTNAEEGRAGRTTEDTEEVNVNQRNWNNVVVATALGLTGLFAVSASGLVAMPLYQSTALLATSGQDTTTTSTTSVTTSTYVKQYGDKTDDELSTLFNNFRVQFSKKYADDEEVAKRFENFKTFLYQIDDRNTEEGAALHDVTKFADLSSDEFSSTYLGFQTSEKLMTKVAARKAARKSATSVEESKGRPPAPSVSTSNDDSSTVNWYMVSTTAVKNQGYCGSCWAFSATEQVESAAIAAGLLTTSDDLAPQQIVSCAGTSLDCYGCDGGDPVGAYEYIESAGGLESNANYPYESYYGDTETCDATTSDYEVTVTDYTILSSEDEMISYVQSTGPLSVCLDASSWASYSKGVVSVCGQEVDHCVQATGINSASGYWIVRNSWGTDWGVNGFIYLKSGANTCDITYLPTYVAVASV